MRSILAAIVAEAALLLAALVPAFADGRLDAYIPPAALAELEARGSVVHSFLAGEALTLTPAAPAAGRIAAEAAAARPMVGVEVLRLTPVLTRPLESPEGRLSALNRLASVSALKDLPYWSASRKKQWVLFTESYTVQSPRQPRRIPDPVFTALPEAALFHSFQADSSFGRNFYKTDVHTDSECIWTCTQNIDAISYLLIPVVPAGGFITYSLVIPVDGRLLFYGTSLLRTTIPLGDATARAESLRNRLLAVSGWLVKALSS
jgi:hypothetical protein